MHTHVQTDSIDAVQGIEVGYVHFWFNTAVPSVRGKKVCLQRYSPVYNATYTVLRRVDVREYS